MLLELYEIFLKNPSISTDTRTFQKGALFFALKGKNFNGNHFAKLALEKGATAVIIDEPVLEKGAKVFYVKDVLETLTDLAHHHRKQKNPLIIGITGSNGKTTTKELIAAVLNSEKPSFFTQGNLNNHIGVPLSLLQIKNETWAIIEMGANHQGEIQKLCQIAAPNWGLITNIGKAHLEGFGGVEGVKKGKKELYDYLITHQGKILFHAEDLTLQPLNYEQKISFSLKDKNAFLYVEKKSDQEGFLSFEYQTQNYHSPCISTHLVGDYNLPNIAYAILVGLLLEIDKEKINAALANYVPQNNRSQQINTQKNKVILDAYNANPSSMEAALKDFAKRKEKKIAILGDMFELGAEGEKEHCQIHQITQKEKIPSIFVGEIFYQSIKKEKNTLVFKNKQELMDFLHKNPILDTTVLIKASRGMDLNSILSLL